MDVKLLNNIQITHCIWIKIAKKDGYMEGILLHGTSRLNMTIYIHTYYLNYFMFYYYVQIHILFFLPIQKYPKSLFKSPENIFCIFYSNF